MVTGKDAFHEQLARVAMRCFEEQTYPHKRLLIVNDGPYSLMTGPHDQIEEIRPRCGKKLTLGELRNIGGFGFAKSPIICQFDDDDWHHPERLEYQIKALKADHAVCLRRQIRYSFVDNSAFVLDRRCGIEGTVVHAETLLCYRDLGMKEDTHFLADAFPGRVQALDNKVTDHIGPGLYIRMAHGHNTWSQGWIMQRMDGQKDRFDLPPPQAAWLQRILKAYYGHIAIPAA